jgi:hypothetical protein
MTSNIINQCPVCGAKEIEDNQMKLEFEKQKIPAMPRNLPCESCERKLRNIFQAKYFFWIYKGSILGRDQALKLAREAVAFGQKDESEE